MDRRDFFQLIDRERMRTNRSGSPFSLLVLALRAMENRASNVKALEDLLLGRLRATDEIGSWSKHTLGVLLPDTTADEAEIVAQDLKMLTAAQSMTLDCEVYCYPSHRPPPRSDGTSDSHFHTGQPLEDLLVKKMPAWKRLMDVLGSLAGIVLLSPLMVVVALAIKLTSRGPVFFSQQRDGLGGKRFTLYKFRTMYADALRRKAELLPLNEQDGPAFKLANDPRVTPLGRWLRRTCIDELPQFWNVLRGDMSLVGPRPLDSEEAKFCEVWQRRRLDVTPGMTCIWQARGGSHISFAEWMRMDIRYIRLRSIWQDLGLLLETFIAVVRRRASK
jgi:lipopolysaccharide/colanic/teichoic acid biosynthesis glycosyltransferase